MNSFMQIRLKNPFLQLNIFATVGEFIRPFIVPYQSLAYYIEEWPIYSLPPFGNSRRNLLYILDEAKANSTLSTIRQIFSHMHATL